MQQSKTSQDQGTYMYHNKQYQVYCKEALHNIKIDAFAICIGILQHIVRIHNTVAKIWRTSYFGNRVVNSNYVL